VAWWCNDIGHWTRNQEVASLTPGRHVGGEMGIFGAKNKFWGQLLTLYAYRNMLDVNKKLSYRRETARQLRMST